MTPATAFDGVTYEPVKDYARLNSQLTLVVRLMRDGQWRTLKEIAFDSKGSEAGVSARLRDLRKPRYASRYPDVRAVDSRRRAGGTWEYRFVVDGKETT